MYGYFYDNSNANRDIHHICPYITFHKVQDNPTFQHGDAQALHSALVEEPKIVKDVAHMYAQHFQHAYYDPESGNTLEDGSDFFQHVINAAKCDHVSAVIFDWDRTLQQFEAMSTHSFDYWCHQFGAESPTQRYQFAKAVAIYHSGGTERFHKLTHMFAELQRHGKHISILTANPAATSPGLSVYHEILGQWGVKYCRLGYTTHKYMTLASDSVLSTICGPDIKF